MNIFRKLAWATLVAAAGLPAAQAAPAAAPVAAPFTRLEPARGEKVRGTGPMRIGAQLRSAAEPGSVVLRVDGVNVTRHLQLKGSAVEYEAYLDVGQHTAELLLRDRAGHEERAAWNFEVVRPYWAWPFSSDDDEDDDFEGDGWWFWER